MSDSPNGVSAEALASISTPDVVDSRLGPLHFTDGAPSSATAELLYDHLDFMHGVEAFIGAFPGASLQAMHEGFKGLGVEDNAVLIYSDLMDSASLFLTANCDTIYFITFLDLSNGPVVLSLPPLGPPTGILGAVDDMWFGWVTDLGVPGPDRGEGGQYLLVGPGYDGPLPDSGFHVSHSRTSTVVAFGRAFMVDNDQRFPPRPSTTASGFTRNPWRCRDGGGNLPRRRRAPTPPGASRNSVHRRVRGLVQHHSSQ